jgi:hypothetical protein
MDALTTGVAGGAVLGGLAAISRPAEALVQRVSDALGLLYEPTRIVRAARADVAADKIRAVGQLEISEIERRGLLRMVKEQGKFQENIEAITAKAVESLGDDAKPENLSDDWIRYFFDKGKLVSDHEMQELWAKMLAGAAGSNGGSFSRNTLNTVSVMDKQDAEFFSALCAFCWTIPGGQKVPVIFDASDSVYVKYGLGTGVVHHLRSLGLILVSDLGHAYTAGHNPTAAYFGRTVTLTHTPGAKKLIDIFAGGLPTGAVAFSSAGYELSRLCAPISVEGFFEYTLRKWAENKWFASDALADSQAGS